ncbi:MAG TPA: phospholipase D-like domain-containing protein [Isosphaeraceae bacterium]|jgi:cardiolipin synthase
MTIPIPTNEQLLIPTLVTALDLVVSLTASAHVVLTKRDTRAAIGWIGLIWLSPILGSALYGLLGINRIRRKARRLRRGKSGTGREPARPCPSAVLHEALTPEGEHLDDLAEVVGRLTELPLLEGNRVEPLTRGDKAYEAMIGAIDGAERSVALSSYIFNDDPAGRQFVAALARAVARQVEVRVLVDDVGRRYDWPTILGPLRRAGVPVATFLPTLVPGWFPYMNLRNHRKILVADGRAGFTGGMNIDADYLDHPRPRRPKADLHFRVEGPVVAHLQRTFADDWAFRTGERLRGAAWFPHLGPAGPILARGIADGPDEQMGKLRIVLQGAIACARSSIAIVTPYFLPDAALISALNVAAMRGVRVDIVLPRRTNHVLVQWASTALLWQVLERGCRVWASPPPFDHTKLMVVDRVWSLVGSANWDPRSLRLNFEFDVECYGPSLAADLDALVRAKIRAAAPITLEQVDGRRLPIRLRDGVARLLSPYL